jgi:hypothetical protein
MTTQYDYHLYFEGKEIGTLKSQGDLISLEGITYHKEKLKALLRVIQTEGVKQFGDMSFENTKAIPKEYLLSEFINQASLLGYNFID